MSSATGTRPLILDLGMHLGDDTDFYLRKGFDVVAVEAAPHLVDLARDRFAAEVADGRLEIRQLAVAEHNGEIDFYLSDQDLWASTRADMADRGQGVVQKRITVPCATLDTILADLPTPHFIKIDVEGQDRNCVESLLKVPDRAAFVSFEADLPDPAETEAMIAMLESIGYRRFKLVNQAVHAGRKLPQPALEGVYAEPRFSKHSSGPFGEESPGDWMSADEVRELFARTIKQQAARIEYSAHGTVLGIPLTRFHRPLMWVYNAPPVAWARLRYSRIRKVEPGGWFDIHAAL